MKQDASLCWVTLVIVSVKASLYFLVVVIIYCSLFHNFHSIKIHIALMLMIISFSFFILAAFKRTWIDYRIMMKETLC